MIKCTMNDIMKSIIFVQSSIRFIHLKSSQCHHTSDLLENKTGAERVAFHRIPVVSFLHAIGSLGRTH